MAPPFKKLVEHLPAGPALDAIRALAPGRSPGMPVEQHRAWPSATGAAPPGMAGEPISVHQPGGNLENQLLHPAVTIEEALFNILPEASWFSSNVAPSRPVQFDFGTFQVPANQNYWLFDYQFQVMVQSGIDANDTIPAVPGRFFGIMGFDLTFTGRRIAATRYELDPHPATLAKTTYTPSATNPFARTPTQAQFDVAAFNSFSASSGAGLSLMPTWDKLMGPRQGPFTLVAPEQSRVTLSCVIFRTVPTPIASIWARVAGYQIPKNVSEAIINRMRPR